MLASIFVILSCASVASVLAQANVSVAERAIPAVTAVDFSKYIGIWYGKMKINVL